MEDAPAHRPTELRDYLRVLGRRRVVILLTAFAAVALAVAYSTLTPPTYSASATVLVPQQQANSALNIQNSQLPAAASLQRSLADEQQFAKGDSVKRTAAQILGFPASVSVGSSTTDDVLVFTAASGDEQRAATVANAYARAYMAARRANQVDQYTQQVTALEQSIASLQAKANSLAAGDPQIPALQQSISTLTQSVEQTEAAGQLAGQVGPSLLKAAVAPTKPSSPNPVRDGILALLVGLILGVALAFVAERLDDGIRSRETAERATGGLPVISLIPAVASWRGKDEHHLALVEDPTSIPSEAYRTLRTAVQFLGIDDPKRVIGLTSSVPGEGKTTTVANLAVSFSRAGQRVAVISCDLRRPRLHEFFDTGNQVGLTTVLLGHATLEDALVQVPGEPSLRLLPSGPVPPNPAEILSLDKVRDVVNVLSERFDIVLLDCPPVLPVTDALLISRLVDGMLIVASIENTSVPDLRRTTDMLRQVDAPLMGTILNRVPTSGSRSYAYYGYGYGAYSSYSASPAESDGERALKSGDIQPHDPVVQSSTIPPAVDTDEPFGSPVRAIDIVSDDSIRYRHVPEGIRGRAPAGPKAGSSPVQTNPAPYGPPSDGRSDTAIFAGSPGDSSGASEDRLPEGNPEHSEQSDLLPTLPDPSERPAAHPFVDYRVGPGNGSAPNR